MSSPPARREAAPSGPPAFRDRTEAGVLLGVALREFLGDSKRHDPERGRAGTGPSAMTRDPPGGSPVVFAIPRGGVAVAAGVARALSAPLDVLVVRKIGHPAAPELGLGAIAEDGAGGAAEPYFDADMRSPDLSRRMKLSEEPDDVILCWRVRTAVFIAEIPEVLDTPFSVHQTHERIGRRRQPVRAAR